MKRVDPPEEFDDLDELTETIHELADAYNDLADEVERLKDERGGDSDGEAKYPGLDHRDQAVVEVIREHGDPGPRGTTELYLSQTDIKNNGTAVERAKQLRNRPDFDEVIGHEQ